MTFRQGDLEQRRRAGAVISNMMELYRSSEPQPVLVMIFTSTPPAFELEPPAPDSVLTAMQRIRIASEVNCAPSDVKGLYYVWMAKPPTHATAREKEILKANMDAASPVGKAIMQQLMEHKYADFAAIGKKHNVPLSDVSQEFWNLRRAGIIRRMNIPIPVAIVDAGASWFPQTSTLMPVVSVPVKVKAGKKEKIEHEFRLAIQYGHTRRLLNTEKWMLEGEAYIPEDEPTRVYRSDEQRGPIKADVSTVRQPLVAGYAFFARGYAKEIKLLLSKLQRLGKWGYGTVSKIQIKNMSAEHVGAFFLRFGEEAVLHRPVPIRYIPKDKFDAANLRMGMVPIRGSRYSRDPSVMHICALEGSILPAKKASERLRTPFKKSETALSGEGSIRPMMESEDAAKAEVAVTVTKT
jgi:hypothetical protein